MGDKKTGSSYRTHANTQGSFPSAQNAFGTLGGAKHTIPSFTRCHFPSSSTRPRPFTHANTKLPSGLIRTRRYGATASSIPNRATRCTTSAAHSPASTTQRRVCDPFTVVSRISISSFIPFPYPMSRIDAMCISVMTRWITFC